MSSLDDILKEVERRGSRQPEAELGYRGGRIQSWRVSGPDRVFEPHWSDNSYREARNDAS